MRKINTLFSKADPKIGGKKLNWNKSDCHRKVNSSEEQPKATKDNGAEMRNVLKLNRESVVLLRGATKGCLKNIGNTCYMNAVVCVLKHTPDFVNRLQELVRRSTTKVGEHFELVCALDETLQALNLSTKYPLRPEKLQKAAQNMPRWL